METLAYLHLALANETPADNDYTALISTWDINWLETLKPHHFSTRATYSLLALTITLGILGTATQASALVREGDRALELSRERVRQIEAKALQKLRQPKRRNRVRDYLEALS